MSVVLDKLDEEKFNENIITSLDFDNAIQNCYTNFRDVVIDTIIQMISEIVEKDGWNLQYFDEDEKEELLISFMENSKITVSLNREANQMDYEFKEITVEFNLSENKKKKIAEIYLNNVLNDSYYFKECIINDFNDVIAKLLSVRVYQLLSSDEIEVRFTDKLEEILNCKE